MIGVTNSIIEPHPQYLNCWELPLVSNVGYSIQESSIDEQGLMMLRGYEYSAGHEGITIRMNGLTIGTTYIFSMKYIHNVVFHSGGYSVSLKISSNQDTATLTGSNYGSWGNKLRQNGGPYTYTETFVADATTMYLGFSGNGFADSGQNNFTYYDICIIPQQTT